jgi:hypothetical protein
MSDAAVAFEDLVSFEDRARAGFSEAAAGEMNELG